jgi:hypothetical protein
LRLIRGFFGPLFVGFDVLGLGPSVNFQLTALSAAQQIARVGLEI